MVCGLCQVLPAEVPESRRVWCPARPSPHRHSLRGAHAASFCALVVSFLGKHPCGLDCWEQWQ